jgi:hypothetical protein
LGSPGVRCEHGGKHVVVKMARAKMQKQRNWAIRKADSLIKESPQSTGKEVKILWTVEGSKERQVVVNNVVAFRQGRDDPHGSFEAEFDSLVIE